MLMCDLFVVANLVYESGTVSSKLPVISTTKQVYYIYGFLLGQLQVCGEIFGDLFLQDFFLMPNSRYNVNYQWT